MYCLLCRCAVHIIYLNDLSMQVCHWRCLLLTTAYRELVTLNEWRSCTPLGTYKALTNNGIIFCIYAYKYTFFCIKIYVWDVWNTYLNNYIYTRALMFPKPCLYIFWIFVCQPGTAIHTPCPLKRLRPKSQATLPPYLNTSSVYIWHIHIADCHSHTQICTYM